ncbi:MAG: MGMT family protein [Cyanobacteriota bacterium]
MGKSAAFARIKEQVLAMTTSIPAGRVSTYRSLAAHIDVVPRHVAYILSTLSEAERAAVPWYRVVAEDGVISAPNAAKARAQIDELLAEEYRVENKKLLELGDRFIAVADLNSGISPQTRPTSPNGSDG